MKRRVLGFTAVRSEYGLLRPVFRAIQAHPKLELQVVVAGTHLVPEFGNTYREVEEDGFPIVDRLDSWVGGDTPAAALKSFALLVAGFTQTLDRVRPDFVLVLGDRNEALAAAIAAAEMYVPLGHIHGGDIGAGYNVDDAIRFSISRFAHLHFAASERSAERLLKSGEEPFRVHVVGAPGLDTALARDLPQAKDVLTRHGLTIEGEYVVVLQHPVTSEREAAFEQMNETLEAVKASGLQAIVIYPNSDPGSQEIIDCITQYVDGRQLFSVPSMEHADFLALIRGAVALVGNSSSGIIETPSLQVPTVNVGPRQKNRERGDNVLDVPYDRGAIRRAIEQARYDKGFLQRVKATRNPYGDGTAGRKIAEILARVTVDDRLLRKAFEF